MLSEESDFRLEGLLVDDLYSGSLVPALGLRVQVPRLVLEVDVEASWLLLFPIEQARGGFGALGLLDDRLLHLAVLLGKEESLLVVFLLILRDLLLFLQRGLVLAIGPLTYCGYGTFLFLEGQRNLQMTLVYLIRVILSLINLSIDILQTTLQVQR